MHKLFIIRGPSGTGKSTIARHLMGNGQFFEADQYFHGPDGYKFDVNKLSQAHVDCQRRVAQAMEDHALTVVVSNTSLSLREAKVYMDLATERHYEIEVIRTPGPWDINLMHKRNKHNVPMKTLEKQLERYAAIEGEGEWTNMEIFQ